MGSERIRVAEQGVDVARAADAEEEELAVALGTLDG